MNNDLPMNMMMRSVPVIMCFSQSDIFSTCLKKDICMNCRHFRKLEDWRETGGGFLYPKGICLNSPPWIKDYKSVHGGEKCPMFSRKSQEE